MLHCLIAGDSIARWLGAFLASTCLTDAWGGSTSADVIARIHPAQIVIVSAGSNDGGDTATAQNLVAIRDKAVKLGAKRILWLVPASGAAEGAVEKIASQNDDETISFVADEDHTHPDCLRCVADDIAHRIGAKTTPPCPCLLPLSPD